MDRPSRCEEAPPNTTFHATKGRRFGAGLCPFHSPLLRASRLFSFPPLINMLKFGGSPCLLSGRRAKRGRRRPAKSSRQAHDRQIGGGPDPGENPKSRGRPPAGTRSKLEATPPPRRGERREPSAREKPLGRDAKPTLSQTWAVDEPVPAMCVQSVDDHMSCSSHSDAQFAAFFIDPRAK